MKLKLAMAATATLIAGGMFPAVSGAVGIDHSFGNGGHRVFSYWRDPMLKVDQLGRIVVVGLDGSIERISPDGTDGNAHFQRSVATSAGPSLYAIEPSLRNGLDPLIGYQIPGKYPCGPAFGLNALTGSAGRLDTTYFTRGVYTVKFVCGAPGIINSVLPMPGGTTLVAGAQVKAGGSKSNLGSSVGTIIKLKQDGSRARGFARNGTLRLPSAGMTNQLNETLDIARAGKRIIAVSYLRGRLVMIRFGPRGHLDKTFSGDGRKFLPGSLKRVCSIASDCRKTNNLELADDGTIFVLAEVGNYGRPVVISTGQNGTLRTTFGGDGRVDPMNFSGTAAGFEPSDLITDRSGGLLLAGKTGTSSETRAAVVRVNADGSLDTSFGIGGIFEIPPMVRLTSIERQGDGFLVGGTLPRKDRPEGDPDMNLSFIVRINPDG